MTDYLLTGEGKAKKATSGNYFSSHAHRGNWEGALTCIWRCGADGVRHEVVARKPLVATAQDICLCKGKPVKVMWLKE